MKRDPLALELRVLNGLHSGACTGARHALLLGTTPESDVIVTDLHANAGMGKVHILDRGQWLIAPANEEPSAEGRERAPKLGEPMHWAGVAWMVCEPHTEWPPLPVGPSPLSSQSEESNSVPAKPERVVDANSNETLMNQNAAASGAGASADAVVPVKQVSPPRTAMRAVLWILATLVGILVLLGIAAYYSGRVFLESNPTSMDAPPDLPDMTAQAQKQVPDLASAIAKVDPGLRLQLTPQRDGLVRVMGWVDSVQQLDRLADVLATQRPAPIMRVLVVSDVRSELTAQLASAYSHIKFVAGDPGVLRVQGIVPSNPVREETLKAVRPLLPSGLVLVDDMKLAEQLVPEIQSALVSAGFKNVKSVWDGKQVWATLSLPASAKNRFEEFLIELAQRFPGLPLRVTPTLMTASITSETGKAPFTILGIVGGDVPYIVLPGGEKLIQGGSHAGWRLQTIEPDVLIFDSPRRLVVSR